MTPARRTPLQTELWWLLGVVLFAVGVAVGGAGWLIWRVLVAGAGC